MKWLYVILAYLSLFCFGIIDNARGPSYPQILIFFSKSTSTGSLIFVFTSISALLTTISGKFWLKRWGAFSSTRFFVLSQAASSFGMGLSGNLQNGFLFLLLFSLLFGVSTGGMMISLNLLAIKASSIDKRMKTLSGLHAMYGIASLIAPLFVTFIYQIGFDWRVVFKILSLIPLSVFIYSFFIPENSRDTLRSRGGGKIPFSLKLSIAAIFAFCVSAEISLSSRMVLYLTTHKNFSHELSSFYLSFFFILLLAGRLLFSFFSFKSTSYKLLIISLFSSFSFLILGFHIHPLGLSFCGLSLSFFFPCAMDLINKELGDSTDFILPIVMTSTGGMLIFMHLFVGILADKIGIHKALHLGPLSLIVSLCFLLISKKLFLRYKNSETKGAFV
jgi:MFS transporter, FHS family, glucose/mannose:H+ symporter